MKNILLLSFVLFIATIVHGQSKTGSSFNGANCDALSVQIDSIGYKSNPNETIDIVFTGDYFTNNMQMVIQGGVVNSITYISSDSIIVNFTATAGAGFYDIAIQNECGIDVIDGGFEITNTCYIPDDNVAWSNVVGTDIGEGKMAKSNTAGTGWVNGASFESSTSDVEMSFEICDQDDRTAQMIGLSNSDINQNYNTIDYAIYLYKNGTTEFVRIYENGSYRGQFFTSWGNGDVYAVRKTGTLVEYLLNGIVFYTSTIPFPIGGAAYFDSSLYNSTFWTGSTTYCNISICEL